MPAGKLDRLDAEQFPRRDVGSNRKPPLARGFSVAGLQAGVTEYFARREGRVATWSDRKSWKLDNKLGELLQELELRSVEDDHREVEERRKAEERHREWELGMERTRERFAQSYRAKILRAQAEAWREANALRTYLAALGVTYGETEEPSEWIEWVSAYIERLDPLRSPPVMPDTSELSAEDLKPFLGGLSPYGPSRW